MAAIEQLRMAMMEEIAAVKLMGYLASAGATMTYMSGYYLVRFPQGTQEVRSDVPPQYQDETTITFPNGSTIIKRQHWPCTHPGCTHIKLVIPGQEERRTRRYA